MQLFLKTSTLRRRKHKTGNLFTTLTHLQSAKEESFLQGIEQGRTEALSSLENQVNEVVQGFRFQVDDLYKQQLQTLEKIYREAQDIAVCIATKHAQTEAEKKRRRSLPPVCAFNFIMSFRKKHLYV